MLQILGKNIKNKGYMNGLCCKNGKRISLNYSRFWCILYWKEINFLCIITPVKRWKTPE